MTQLIKFGKRFAVMLLLAVYCFMYVGQNVSALSDAQKQLYESNILYYDKDASLPCAAADTTLVGNANGEKIFNYFVSKGLQPFQAAGIVGNMSAESGLQPQRLQGTPSGTITPAESFSGSQGWGLVQWTPGSKFIDTNTPKTNANDLAVQLDFIWNQLQGKGPLPEKQAGDDIKAVTTLEDAVLAWQGNQQVGGTFFGFERPLDESGSVSTRTSAAKAALAKYGGGAVSSSSTCGAVSTNGCVNPVDDPQWHPGRTDQGVDYTLDVNLPVKAICDGTIKETDGAGWPGGYFIIIKMTSGPFVGKCTFVAEHLSNPLPVGSQVKAGQTIATALGGYPYTEWGWAAGPQTPSVQYGGSPDGTPMPGGKAFARFLRSLGAKTADDPGPGPLYDGASCP